MKKERDFNQEYVDMVIRHEQELRELEEERDNYKKWYEPFFAREPHPPLIVLQNSQKKYPYDEWIEIIRVNVIPYLNTDLMPGITHDRKKKSKNKK